MQYKLGVLAAFAMLVSGGAAAATYTVWLKNAAGQPYEIGGVKCATGSANSDTNLFSMTIKAGCFGSSVPAADVIITDQSGTVKTAMIQSKDELPVSSADGITSSGSVLTLTWSSNAPAIGTRNFTFDTISGTYYLYNDIRPLPEPETLWLALAGLAGLAWSRRKRR